MAVFTKLEEKEIKEFINIYDIGNLEKYDEIVEGIENTNYLIICNKKRYILTIFERRVEEQDIPFFIDLKLFLSENNFKCPKPLMNKNGEIINSLKNKKAIIISFIEGKKIDTPNSMQCKEVGKMLGDLHVITMNFNKKRENSLGIKEWKNLFNKCEKSNEGYFDEIISDLKKEIYFLENTWPKNLPSGIIHADLFKDNIFFKENKIIGVIDFYFSCYHFFIYDISIVINDWCFEENGKVFKHKYFDAIIEGYNSKRKLKSEEISALNLILRAATVRILVTRLHDYIFHPKDSIVVKKDPYQYHNILKWHQNNKL